MKFKFDYHNKILTILQSLNPEILIKGNAYFSGGTLLTLDLGEYRWSKDIDFICPVSLSGYRYRCFSNLQINEYQIPKIIDGIDCLADDLYLAKTNRTFQETYHDFY